MDSLFSVPIDFIWISASFILTMLLFFGLPGKKYRWLRYSNLFVFSSQCMLIILFHKDLRERIFGALMLMSTLIVQVTVTNRRKLQAGEHRH